VLNLAPARIFLCVEPTDMRKSYDTLALLVRDHLQGDPLSGSWFVFRGKRNDRLKILYWDGDGYALWQKRLEAGTFEFPQVTTATTSVEIRASDLALILSGIELSARRRKRYVRPAPAAEQCL
jgi:transposase